MGQGAAGAALALRREFGRAHHGARFLGRADARRNDAERAAVQHALDIVGRIGRYAHHRHDAAAQRRQTNLSGHVERDGRVLHVDIDHVEAGGLGHARDFDAARQPDGHRGDDFVSRQLVPDNVPYDLGSFHEPAPFARTMGGGRGGGQQGVWRWTVLVKPAKLTRSTVRQTPDGEEHADAERRVRLASGWSRPRAG